MEMTLCTKNVQLSEKHVLFTICEETQQKPIATAILNLSNNEIGWLLVDMEFRQQGVGTKLIKAIEQYAKNFGLKSIHAITHPSNATTRAFFKTLGYEEWIKLYKKIEKNEV